MVIIEKSSRVRRIAENSDPDTKAAREQRKCKALPDEAMYGQPVSVYQESNPSLGTEMKIWISKSTNRHIRMDMTNDQGTTMKLVTVSRYEYSGVQEPAHSVTTRDSVKSGAGH